MILEVRDGAEAEAGGGACVVLHRAGQRGDVEAGGGSRRGVPNDRALLVCTVPWCAAAGGAASPALAAVAGRSGGDLPWSGRTEDVHRDRVGAGAGGLHELPRHTQPRPQRLPRGARRPAPPPPPPPPPARG